MLDAHEAHEPIAAYEFQPTSIAFAVTLSGESMVNPHGGADSFPPGTTLLVDPSIKARSGDYVLARDPISQETTFKRLVSDAGRWYLKPLNPAFPTTELTSPDAAIIGRVMEAQTRRKL